nr:hypothetical protein [Tanacetum cinerariifolium]
MTDGLEFTRMIITVNVIPPAHVDDVPVVEPNQHNDVLVIPEPVLVDEEKDPEEDEFEEEDPQEEEDDMEVDIEEDENEPDVHKVGESSTALFLREESDEIKAKDEYYGKLILDLGNEVRSSMEQGTAAMDKLVEKLGNAEDKAKCKKLKNKLEEAKFSNTFLHIQNERHEDETVPVSVHKVGESSTALFLREESDEIKAKDEYYGKLILDLGNEVRSSKQGTAAMDKLVEKLGNAEDKAKCKKLKNKLEEAKFSNTFLHIQNERVERDLYWTRV